jgi:hypothetical protein
MDFFKHRPSFSWVGVQKSRPDTIPRALERSAVTTINFDCSTSRFPSIMLEVSATRIPLTVTIIAITMLASPLAYGQAASGKGQVGAQGTRGKPSGPASGGGDSTLISPKQPTLAPPSDALSNLAGGGYADPNYVPPGTQSKKSTRHRVIRAPRARTLRRFEHYSVNPAFPYQYCYCDY